MLGARHALGRGVFSDDEDHGGRLLPSTLCDAAISRVLLRTLSWGGFKRNNLKALRAQTDVLGCITHDNAALRQWYHFTSQKSTSPYRIRRSPPLIQESRIGCRFV